MLCNSLWKNNIQILDNQKHNQELILTLEEIDSLFNRNILNIYDCLILDCTLDRSEKLEITREQFEAVIDYNGDRTGFEYSNNEFRIIDYIEKNLNMRDQYLLTMSYIQYLNSRLTLMTQNNIFYILFCDENILQIRFHQEWKEDRPIFSKDKGIADLNHPIAIYTNKDFPNNRLDVFFE